MAPFNPPTYRPLLRCTLHSHAHTPSSSRPPHRTPIPNSAALPRTTPSKAFAAHPTAMLFLCGTADVHARRHVNRPPNPPLPARHRRSGTHAAVCLGPRLAKRLEAAPWAPCGARWGRGGGRGRCGQRLCPSVLSLCAQVPRACAEAFVARLRAAAAYTDPTPTRLRLNVLPSGGWCGHIFRDQAEVTRQTLAFFAETA